MNLSLEQQATNYVTMRHIERVRNILNEFVANLLQRGQKHDQSKLESPEVELFTEYTPKLAGCTYGSPQYEAFRKAMGPALAHHYAHNSHHPEHFKNGVNDMTLLDVVEMLADWSAAAKRHNDGDVYKSIEINRQRFGISAQLAAILVNTVREFNL